MAISEEERDAEFKSCIKEIREFSVILYHIIKTATFRWNTKGTAFVTAKSGCIHFECNKNFWDKLNQEEHLFLILHECYHVLLDHFKRFPKVTRTSNKAMDLAVNHALLKHFSFKRKKMPFLSKIGCWVDTVIPDQVLLDTLSAEEYLYALEKYEKDNPGSASTGEGSDGMEGLIGEQGSMDDHAQSKGEALNDILTKVLKGLPEELQEKEDLSEGQVEQKLKEFAESLGEEVGAAITGAGFGKSAEKPLIKVEKKRKTTWLQFAKRLEKIVKGDRQQTAWLPDRRTGSLANKNMFLPSYREDEGKEGKVLVVLFLDTSTSCDHLRPHFFGFAKALPKEVFEVVAFGFTTRTYRLDLDMPRFHDGGTSFQEFEAVFNRVEAKKKYAFIFTDGDAGAVEFESPEKWYWFLDEPINSYNTRAIPKACTVQCLQEFE